MQLTAALSYHQRVCAHPDGAFFVVLVWQCWYGLFFVAQRQGYLPLVVRWGSLTHSRAGMWAGVVSDLFLRPAIRGNFGQSKRKYLIT